MEKKVSFWSKIKDGFNSIWFIKIIKYLFKKKEII